MTPSKAGLPPGQTFHAAGPSQDRISTLSFNSSLMREMRAIAFITRMIDKGFDDDGRMKKVFMHCIDAEQELRTLGVSSKVNVEWSFLTWLFELGRQTG